MYALEKIRWEESASQLRMLSKNLLEINTLKILTCIGFADAGFLKTIRKRDLWDSPFVAPDPKSRSHFAIKPA